MPGIAMSASPARHDLGLDRVQRPRKGCRIARTEPRAEFADRHDLAEAFAGGRGSASPASASIDSTAERICSAVTAAGRGMQASWRGK
jgi:hypothetical protein